MRSGITTAGPIIHEIPTLVGRLHRDVAMGAVGVDHREITEAATTQAPWLADDQVRTIADRVLLRVSGLGEVEELLADDDVTDVLVSGSGPVLVERLGCLTESNVVLDEEGVTVLVERIMSTGRRRVDRRHPTADVRLPGGFRANVVIAPAAVDGPHVSIRRFRTRSVSLDDLCPPEVAALLTDAVQRRANIVICGGTGAGKTTVLGLLLDECPPSQRIVTIEDVVELRCSRRLVRLEAQPDDGEGSAPISVRSLFRNALRMRPDRLVIGEIRGEEATDLLQALGTGHRGSMATVHADDPGAALRRLQLLVSGSGSVDAELARAQLAAVIDLVVHVQRDADGRRLVAGVGALTHGELTSLYGPSSAWS